MKDKPKDISGKNTAKESPQDRILRETAERYDKSGELYPGDFDKALNNIIHADPNKAEIEAEVQAILDGTDLLRPNPFIAEIKRLRIEAGLSIEELSRITGVNVQAIESGDKDKMKLSDTVKVLKYLTKDK